MSFELKWYGDQIEAAWTKKGTAGVQRGLEHLRDKAAERAPKDKGNLRRSGKVEPEGLTGKVTFGDDPSKGVIAVVQHERFDFHHSEGGPKYLERAMLAEARTIHNIIVQEFK